MTEAEILKTGDPVIKQEFKEDIKFILNPLQKKEIKRKTRRWKKEYYFQQDKLIRMRYIALAGGVGWFLLILHLIVKHL